MAPTAAETGLHLKPCGRCALAVRPAGKVSTTGRSPLIRDKYPTLCVVAKKRQSQHPATAKHDQ